MLTSLASLTFLLLAASTTTLALPAETIQRKVAAAPASSSSSTTTTDNNPLPPAAAISEAYYLITNATISSSSLASKTETFTVTVQGVEAGALRVPCTLTWTPPPTDTITSVQNLTCVTEQVHVKLVRANRDPAKAWFLTVQWEGYGAAEWRNRIEYDPAWTKKTTTDEKTTWTFSGGADGNGTMINGAVQTEPEDLAKILAAPSGGLGPYLGWA